MAARMIRGLTGWMVCWLIGVSAIYALVWPTHVEAHDVPRDPEERMLILFIAALCVARLVSSLVEEYSRKRGRDGRA